MNAWNLAINNVTKKVTPPNYEPMAKCPQCGKPMPKLLTNRMKRKFCSRSCSTTYHYAEKRNASRESSGT